MVMTIMFYIIRGIKSIEMCWYFYGKWFHAFRCYSNLKRSSINRVSMAKHCDSPSIQIISDEKHNLSSFTSSFSFMFSHFTFSFRNSFKAYHIKLCRNLPSTKWLVFFLSILASRNSMMCLLSFISPTFSPYSTVKIYRMCSTEIVAFHFSLSQFFSFDLCSLKNEKL